MKPVRIRRLIDSDIPFAMSLKESAGWNQTEDDWRSFLAFRPDGCFLAEWEGQPAGTVTTIDYQGALGWIGMLLVKRELQGRGIGRRLLETAVESLSNCGGVLLDATPAGRRIYLPMGFEDVEGLERRVRPEGAGAGAGSAQRLEDPAPASIELEPFRPEHLAAASAFDAPVFTAERDQVLAAWLRSAPHLAWVASTRDALAGFCLGRRGSRAEHIGPIVAVSLPAARALLERAIESAGDRPLLADTFLRNAEWLRVLDRLGFVTERPFIRMRRGADKPSTGTGSTSYWVAAGPEVG